MSDLKLYPINLCLINYDLNPTFEQKNFKNEDMTSNLISKGKMAGNKRRKKSTKILIHQNNQEGFYPT